MSKLTTYIVGAEIELDNQIHKVYYTVNNAWAFDINDPNVQYFKSIESAEDDLLTPIMNNLIKSGLHFRKIRKIYIMNNNGIIIKQHNV